MHSSYYIFEYDNFGDRRIKELSIHGYADESFLSVIDLDFLGGIDWPSLLGYGVTCKCRYKFQSLNQVELFTSALTTFLKKATTNYWLIGKFSLTGLFSLLCIFNFLYALMTVSAPIMKASFPTFIFACIAAIIIYAFVWGIDYSLRKLFPPIVFLLGEENARQEKNNERRKNIFWGVLITSLITIVGAWLCNQIF